MKTKTKILLLSTLCITGILFGQYTPGYSAWNLEYSNIETYPNNSAVFDKQNGENQLRIKQVSYPAWNRSSWAYRSKTYLYDTTKPTCGKVELYVDGDLSKPVELGDWSSGNVMARIQCIDTYSGCRDEYSPMKPVGYQTVPTATFEDNSYCATYEGNKNTCTGNLEGKLILSDKVVPDIEYGSIGDLNIKELSEEEDNNFIADDSFQKIEVSVRDRKIESNGVSGLKSYDFTITFIEDHLGEVKNDVICEKREEYPEHNPLIDGNVHSNEDIEDISITCAEIYESGQLKVTRVGKYILRLVVTDSAGNEEVLEREYYIYPDKPHIGKTKIKVLEAKHSQYANGTDSYTYKVVLSDRHGNPVYNKKIKGLNQDISDFTGGANILLTIDSTPGEIALKLEHDEATNSNGELEFRLSSYVPGDFSQRFHFDIIGWDSDYNDVPNDVYSIIISIPQNSSFKSPYRVEIFGSDDDGLTWVGKPEVGTVKRYKLELLEEVGITPVTAPFVNKKLSSFSYAEGHIGEDYEDINPREFYLRLNAISNALTRAVIDVSNLEVSYKIGGHDVSYILDNYVLGGDSQSTLGVEITGILQSNGEGAETGQEENFSQLPRSVYRKEIHKSAEKYMKSLQGGAELPNIKYVEGEDVTIDSSTIDYELLIVKNANVYITSNINAAHEKLGIIVLHEDHNLVNDYATKGNIYVGPNVSYIGAVIYADGGFIAVDHQGKVFSEDSPERTKTLNKQLILSGYLFTRNTIGGSLLGSDNAYTLPGGEKTTSFDLAMYYDLNYIRRGILGCVDEDLDEECEKSKPFHIDPLASIIPKAMLDIDNF